MPVQTAGVVALGAALDASPPATRKQVQGAVMAQKEEVAGLEQEEQAKALVPSHPFSPSSRLNCLLLDGEVEVQKALREEAREVAEEEAL